MVVNEEQVRTAVEWFAERWIRSDSLAAFKSALEAIVRREIASRPSDTPDNWQLVNLYVDYDPQGPLLEAVRAAGVECRGFMYSADGIFAGRKFGLTLYPNRTTAKLGYGNWSDEPIWQR